MSDDELAERLKHGDESAFGALYERHSQSLLRHLSHLMGNAEEAEELLHEVMMLMIRKIDFYTPRSDLKASFKTWLFRLATNRAIDEIRKRKKKQVPDEESIPSEEERLEQKESETHLKSSLEELPPLQRTVLGLRIYDDLSYLEIALICGKDVNAIKQGLFQAKQSLKTILAEGGHT